MTAEEYLNSLFTDGNYKGKKEEITIQEVEKALEMKAREHQEKIREIRREIMTVKNYDTAIFIERTAVIEILDKHLDDKK